MCISTWPCVCRHADETEPAPDIQRDPSQASCQLEWCCILRVCVFLSLLTESYQLAIIIQNKRETFYLIRFENIAFYFFWRSTSVSELSEKYRHSWIWAVEKDCASTQIRGYRIRFCSNAPKEMETLRTHKHSHTLRMSRLKNNWSGHLQLFSANPQLHRRRPDIQLWWRSSR